MKVLYGNLETNQRLTAGLLFEPRDLWVGVFWNTVLRYKSGVSERGYASKYLLIYISVIPAFPFCFSWRIK